RLSAPRGLSALDRQPADDRLAAPCRGRRAPARARPGPLPFRHRPLEARPVDRCPRPARGVRAPGRELGMGRRTPRPARGRGAQAARRPGPRRRVPAQPLLYPAAAQARAGAGTPRLTATVRNRLAVAAVGLVASAVLAV